MTYTTHFLGGALAAELLARHVGLPTTAGFLAVFAGALGGLLPDADHPQSYVGRRLPLVSDLAFHTLGHRGGLHSLLMCCLIYLAGRWLISVLPFTVPGGVYLAQALAAGYLSHLVLDALNPQGVKPLWPISWRLAVPLAESGGILERAVFTPVLFLGALSLFLQMPGPVSEAWRELTGALGLPAEVGRILRTIWDYLFQIF